MIIQSYDDNDDDDDYVFSIQHVSQMINTVHTLFTLNQKNLQFFM